MPRPESYKEVEQKKCCGTCRHSKCVAYKQDFLLCFHGDNIEVSRDSPTIFECHVEIDGIDVGLSEGDEFDRIWAVRNVDEVSGICNEWEPEP